LNGEVDQPEKRGNALIFVLPSRPVLDLSDDGDKGQMPVMLSLIEFHAECDHNPTINWVHYDRNA
jgi:hypothetical protein